ncbi:putative c6 zinc finger domain protein [Phaeoacremonium minimum UCRPA7]|uniref:Putative c6 zinc finger domain protein n=1 Tax=Phaeoacremonium minimum (strain UCR-PA7) TaxID=1286976 RepID=R8BSY2_PHAM7|nr:putative c6 zinc finger domain protein [Phaeoacremonium minimum UCRPA7]EOO02409.1 putative c6 zinc finger domain protein [Phaeoacremonium minimum UCRPA7]
MNRRESKICRACEPCRRRKIRCSGERPCQHARCQAKPSECRYRVKARIRGSLKAVLSHSTGLAINSPAQTVELPSDARQIEHPELEAAAAAPAAASTSTPGPGLGLGPDDPVHNSITATHSAPTATDSSQLFYGASSNFAFLHQVHRGILHNASAQDQPRNREVQEGGPSLDMFMQRTLFFGTPSRIDAEVIRIRPAASLQHIPQALARVFLDHFKNVCLPRLPFFTSSELETFLYDLYIDENGPDKSALLPQTKAVFLAVLALGALCTPHTNAAEILIMQAKCQVAMYDDAVTLQMLQFSLLMSGYQLDMGRPNSAYLHLGVACRKAFALGLHKESASTIDSEETLEKQRATLWSLYCHETLTSLVLGRKSALKLSDICCLMPKDRPQLVRFCRLSSIIEDAVDTIYHHRSESLLQLYEKAERVHARLLQYADEFGIASAGTGHNRNKFDDLGSLILHNWYYLAVMLVFRPFLVADFALRSAGSVSYDERMWLRHACRCAVDAAQDSITFASNMFRKPDLGSTDVRAHAVRLHGFFFDACCTVLLYDILSHPSKYTFNLDYIQSALRCLNAMVHDEPITATTSSIETMLKAVEMSISQQHHTYHAPYPPQTLLAMPAASASPNTQLEQRPLPRAGIAHSAPIFGTQWLPMGKDEMILFSDRSLSHQPGSSQQELRLHEIPAAASGTGELEAVAPPPDLFSNLNLDVLTTDLLNFFPVGVTTPEGTAAAVMSGERPVP